MPKTIRVDAKTIRVDYNIRRITTGHDQILDADAPSA